MNTDFSIRKRYGFSRIKGSAEPCEDVLARIFYYKGGLKGQVLLSAQGRAKRHPGFYVHVFFTPCKGKNIKISVTHHQTARVKNPVPVDPVHAPKW